MFKIKTSVSQSIDQSVSQIHWIYSTCPSGKEPVGNILERGGSFKAEKSDFLSQFSQLATAPGFLLVREMTPEGVTACC